MHISLEPATVLPRLKDLYHCHLHSALEKRRHGWIAQSLTASKPRHHPMSDLEAPAPNTYLQRLTHANLSPLSASGMAQICSVLSPSPSPTLSPPDPCQGSPRVKWRHLEGDNLSAACTQSPNDLVAHGVCGTPVEKTKLAPPTLMKAFAPFPWATELLSPFA